MGQGWRSALKGLLLCSLSIFGLYAVMHFGAYAFSGSWSGHAQWVARSIAEFLLIISLIYWAVAACVRSWPYRKSRLVHALAVVGVLCILLDGANRYFGWADTYCDFVPFPHQGFQLSKIMECPTSETFFTILINTGLFLILASLVVRVAYRCELPSSDPS